MVEEGQAQGAICLDLKASEATGEVIKLSLPHGQAPAVVGGSGNENYHPPQLISEQVAGFGQARRGHCNCFFVDCPCEVAEYAGELIPYPIEISVDQQNREFELFEQANVEPFRRLG